MMLFCKRKFFFENIPEYIMMVSKKYITLGRKTIKTHQPHGKRKN